ncbi:prepilin peptidase [Klebsiella sp. PL-2018]|uniref:prepilin peptidase n=1 Tax=Klebsiella TaxID=570 RepID=UPI001C24F5EE|nr:prepilin peptidase [Klebsiella sp. PL-2018]
MPSLIVWRLSPLAALATLCVLYLLARLSLADVRRFSDASALPVCVREPVRSAGLWLFCLAGLWVFASQAPLLTRLLSLLLLTLLLRLAVIDALTCQLPRRDTLSVLATGLCAGLLQQTPSVIDTALAALLCTGLHLVLNRHRENLGRGDLFLITGLAAWAGLLPALQITFAAVVAFILWHRSWRIRGRIEGPLGPWLSLAATAQQLHALYHPIWVTP